MEGSFYNKRAQHKNPLRNCLLEGINLLFNAKSGKRGLSKVRPIEEKMNPQAAQETVAFVLKGGATRFASSNAKFVK